MRFTDNQRAQLALWYVVNTSLISYHKLIKAFGSAAQALDNTDAWRSLSLHKSHLERSADHRSIDAFLHSVTDKLNKDVFGLLFMDDEYYPTQFKQLYDPPPLLFYIGNPKRLNERQLAIVGTRHPSTYAQKIAFDMAQYLVQAGFVITSGLAVGVDSFAHQGALAQENPTFQGLTVGVMGTGIDICYPKQNQALFHQIVQSGGCLISELLPGTPASQHTFPRRNRLVVGLSLATIVVEAAIQSGSMVSARLSAEQGKQVFVIPNRIDSPAAEGCHHLIREGATLIYHPKQIIEDLDNYAPIQGLVFSKKDSIYTAQSTTQNNKNKSQSKDVVIDKSIVINQPSQSLSSPTLPLHLTQTYHALGGDFKDLDSLVEITGLTIADLLAYLVELELLGLVNQVGGRYAKS